MEKNLSQPKEDPQERFVDEEKTVEEKSVRATRALIQTFLQTVKAFRIYEANHPILLKFLERLKKDFDNYFEEFDSFPLLVGEHRLFYRGKVVYDNQDIKESLAFFFFKDGIREIKFLAGLEFREVVDFLQVVRKSEVVNRMEDDLVTLLWEKDFSHILFGTVDEFLEGASSFIPSTEEEFAQRLEFKAFGKGETGESGPEERDMENRSLKIEGLKQALNPLPGQSLVQACLPSPEETEEINREIDQEYQPDYIYLLVDNLVEILLHLGEDMDAYENMISYFERNAWSFLEQREVRKAVAILRKLNDTMESMVLKDKQIFAIRRILDTFSGSRSIGLLGESMNGNGEADSEAILQYLRLLTRKAVAPLCHLLEKVESGKWRKVICDTLAELAREEIQPLLPFLSDSNPHLVRHILYVLGKIGHPSTLKYLGKAALHEDSKVREETLHVLKKMGPPGKELFKKFLNDPMPELRAKASLFFAKVAGAEAAQPLAGIILSKDFYKREYEEKASFLRALSETGATEVVPVLQKIARKKRWFGKAKWEEMRLCARQALKMLGVEDGADSATKRHR